MAPTETLSLQRTEAEERARLLTVLQMAVTLDLTGSESFASSTTVTFDAATPGAATFVDFHGRELHSATLNGTALDPTGWRQGRLPLAGLDAHNILTIEGVMDYSDDGEGLHRHVDPADGRSYLYAMSFLAAGPRWFACFDQPDLKARYVLDVTAPPEWTVLGNGPSVAVAPGRWRIAPSAPLSTYFVTLVAGPYASVSDEHDGIRLGAHVRASLGEALQAEAEDIFTVTKQSFDYYHRSFGVRYPFGEYQQAFVPDFNAGAMENPGCVTLRDQFIYRARATRSERASRAGVIAHEMAHMWFGDLVTMRWWDDLWLNESFAEYMAHRCCAEATAYPLWTEFGIVRKDWGSVADQSAATHPVAGSGAGDAQAALQDFDGISYAKGAAVLRQLAGFLGEEVFLAGLRRHFERHAYGNAEFADLMRIWAEVGAPGLSESDLAGWADGWLRTAGMDTLDVHKGEGGLRLVRVPPKSQPADRVHAVTAVALDSGGRELARTPVRLGAEPVPLEAPAGTALVVPDGGDETWAKIRCGSDSWAPFASVLAGLGEPAPRVVLANAVRDSVRDGDLDPAEALTLLCGATATESEDVVVRSTVEFAIEQLAGPYCAPEHRDARTAQVAAAGQQRLEYADAGSDRQLVAFRLVVRTSSDAGRLEAWLSGTALPAGLALDSELTWALVDRLTVLRGEPDLIEATLLADPSATAAVHAARARAGLPRSEAKERAWALLVGNSETSAYDLYATAEGFWRPDQPAITEPFVERYFTEMPPTAAFRSGWVLGRVAALAYPGLFATPTTQLLAAACLARPDLAAPIRRAVVDGTDQLGRAVQSRERFG